ncbi:MAG: DUF86 domain-containing protein [Serpentinimonas sp.]|nr:MAG: hypothetical protein JM57_03070 [Comamonadaceae bacterium BICA1-1]MDO8275351.1 DUF86 domain-containing protein [Serpentinimonas sp.]MDO9610546.1 DUF86 domain-containing protein [Serpentinimonas sp.]
MRLELYQAECARIAQDCASMLDQAKVLFSTSGRSLTPLEQGGVLHALQVLIENAIGKAKHQLKALGADVPVSAYDAFAALAQRGLIPPPDLARWNAVVGLRNRIVHDYMNIDMAQIAAIVQEDRHFFVLDFLHSPLQAP